jgi:hypothetical protein
VCMELLFLIARMRIFFNLSCCFSSLGVFVMIVIFV